MTDPTTSAEPPLCAQIEIAAPPAKVWAVLTDFRNLAEASPELMTMKPLRRGGLRVGQTYLGVNRRKAAVWPTRNTIVALEPERILGWDTADSGARWIFELIPTESGTRLVQSRPIAVRRPPVGRLFAKLFLGGAAGHDDELASAMEKTLAHLKQVAEA